MYEQQLIVCKTYAKDNRARGTKKLDAYKSSSMGSSYYLNWASTSHEISRQGIDNLYQNGELSSFQVEESELI